MLKMRLQRVGRKHDPSFRIIVTESQRGPRAGRYVDLIGNYGVKHGTVKIDGEKAKLWMSRGVQASGTVWNLLVSEGIIEGKKANVLPKKTVQKKEGEEKSEETTPAVSNETSDETEHEKKESEDGGTSAQEVEQTESVPPSETESKDGQTTETKEEK